MERIDKLIENMSKAIIGKENVIKKIIVCVLCNGHILLEDVPGVGKTTMVYSLAKSLNMSFNRILYTAKNMVNLNLRAVLYLTTLF